MADALTIRQLARACGLCVVAGYVDAIGYTELGGVFAANMTGNSVLMAVAVMRGEWPRAASYGVTLVVFLLAAFLASAFRRATARPAVPLAAAAVVLLLGAMAASLAPDLRLALLAAAMGMQGAAISRFGPLGLQTVVVTGTMVRLADSLAAQILPRGEWAGAAALRLDPAAWAAYIAGAAAAIAVRHVLGRPLLLAALLLALIAADVARDRATAR